MQGLWLHKLKTSQFQSRHSGIAAGVLAVAGALLLDNLQRSVPQRICRHQATVWGHVEGGKILI